MHVCVTSWANCPSEDCSGPCLLFDYVGVGVDTLARLLGLVGCSKLRCSLVFTPTVSCETFSTGPPLSTSQLISLDPHQVDCSQVVETWQRQSR